MGVRSRGIGDRRERYVDIGLPKRVIEIDPASLPVPEPAPILEPSVEPLVDPGPVTAPERTPEPAEER